MAFSVVQSFATVGDGFSGTSVQQTNITGSATSIAGDWVASIIAFREESQGIAFPWIRA